MNTTCVSSTMDDYIASLDKIGREIAKVHASDVDKNCRFPTEAVEAMRAIGAFIWPIPKEYGGMGANPFELAKACKVIGHYCASTAAILAMHYTQILSAVHHANNDENLIGYLRKCAKENRLIASVTSEVGPGGNMRNSSCAVEIEGGQYNLYKNATTVSYGSYADDLMITARKDANAAPGDQVLVIAEKGKFELKDIGEWDTLGMRGTCSPPAKVYAKGPSWQVMSTPFADIATYTMVPTSHIFWSASWLGLASEATSKVRELLRAKGRSNPGSMPLGAHRVADLDAALQSMEFEVMGLAKEYSDAILANDMQKLGGMAFALRINALKLNSSRNVVAIVSEALAICGIQGYKNNGPFSLGRHLRDAFSSIMQVHNDRIQQTNASMLLIHKGF